MLYVYRFRLYPTKEQTEFLNKQIGHCRFVYNKLLETAKENHEKEGKKWNYYEYKKLLPKLKEEYPFLKEANSQSLQEAVKWLDRAFKNFLKGLAKFPRFKSKKRVNSVSIPQHFRIEGNRVKIPKLKTPIKFKKHREIEGKIKSISITRRRWCICKRCQRRYTRSGTAGSAASPWPAASYSWPRSWARCPWRQT